MNNLSSSGHVPVCLFFSQSIAASSVRSRPSLNLCDTEAVKVVYYVAYHHQRPDASNTDEVRKGLQGGKGGKKVGFGFEKKHKDISTNFRNTYHITLV